MAEFEVTLATDDIVASDGLSIFQDKGVSDFVLSDDLLKMEFFDGTLEPSFTHIVISEDLSAEDLILLAHSRSAMDQVSVVDQVVILALETLDIDDARGLNSRKIRIDFDRGVKINEALTQVASYNIQPVTAGAAPVTPLSVELPVGQLNPLFVQINTTEHTDEADYSVALVGALEGIGGEPTDGAPFTYEGIGLTPSVVLVLGIDQNTVEVQFNELMLDNDAIRDLARYSFDQGLGITEIESIFENIVTLKTTAQTPGVVYNLTILGSDFLTSADSDSVDVTDSVAILVETDLIQVVVDDVVVVADQVDIQLFKTILIEKAESIQVSDSVVVSFATGASQTDSIEVTDSVGTDLFHFGIAESISVADQVLRETDSVRMFADSVAASDQVAAEIITILANQVVKGSDEDIVVIGSAEDIVIAGS